MQIKLDFSLNGSAARREYLEEYLKGIDVSRLTQDNLEVMSNYILWAVQEEEGVDFEIESKNSPWAKGKAAISLEAMMEQEQETGKGVQGQISDVGLKGQRRKLDRAVVLTKLAKGKRDVIGVIAEGMAQRPSEDCFAILRTLVQEGAIDLQELVGQGFALDLPVGLEPSYTQIADALFSLQDWHPLTNAWFDLWAQIDMTEFMVQSWEMAHGKRRVDLPIRDELHLRLARYLVWTKRPVSLAQFEKELVDKQAEWEGHLYLKKKRSLVNLRTQQYSYLDAIQGDTIFRRGNPGMFWHEGDSGITGFYPLSDPALLIETPSEEHFSRSYQDLCIRALRELDEEETRGRREKRGILDLRDPEVIRNLILHYHDLNEARLRMTDSEGTVLNNLMRYFHYYVDLCELPPELKRILTLKMSKVNNREIAEILLQEYGLEYKENYISTIFTKRIIEEIVKQVELHYRLIEFITVGKSVFKRCSRCGKLYPRNTNYFNKRTSTCDGFFSNCKKCKTRRKD